MGLTRRLVLGAASLLPLVRVGHAAPQFKRVSLGDWASARPHVQSLERALRLMRGLDPSHPHSLAWQANNHARLFAGIHGSWNFFPWHRAQLLFFEAIVRDLSGDRNFALPYWDPTESNTARLPRWLFEGPFASARNPGVERLNIYQDRLDRKWGSMPARMDEGQFSVFAGGAPMRGVDLSGSIERGTHNIIHRQIGGAMASAASPGDPIFWLHHCNIDRIWATWQERLGAGTFASPKYPRSWRTDAFVGQFARPPQSVVPLNPASVALADTIDYPRLNYGYDQLYPLALFGTHDVSKRMSYGDRAITLLPTEGAPLSFGHPVQLTTRVPLRVPMNPTRESRVRQWTQVDEAYLTVDVDGDGDALDQYFLQAYATKAGAPPPAGPDTPGFIETMVPRGMRHEHDHAMTLSYRMNATDAVALALEGGGDISVTITAGPMGGALNLSRGLRVAGMALDVTLSEWGW